MPILNTFNVQPDSLSGTGRHCLTFGATMRQPIEVDHDTAIADVACIFNGVNVSRKRKLKPQFHVSLALSTVVADVVAKGGKFLSVKHTDDYAVEVTYIINGEIVVIKVKDDR